MMNRNGFNVKRNRMGVPCFSELISLVFLNIYSHSQLDFLWIKQMPDFLF